jgi:hypothetical protein
MLEGTQNVSLVLRSSARSVTISHEHVSMFVYLRCWRCQAFDFGQEDAKAVRHLTSWSKSRRSFSPTLSKVAAVRS